MVYEWFIYGSTRRSVSGRGIKANLFYSLPSLPSVSTDRTCKHGPHSDVWLVFNLNHFNFGRHYDPVNAIFGTVSVGLLFHFFPLKNTRTRTETVSENSCSTKVSPFVLDRFCPWKPSVYTSTRTRIIITNSTWTLSVNARLRSYRVFFFLSKLFKM